MMKHGAITQFRSTDAETQEETATMLKHEPLAVKADTVKAKFTWLKQPVNCDAETASTAMRRSCYTSRNINTLFISLISIRLRENRTPYVDLERRYDLV